MSYSIFSCPLLSFSFFFQCYGDHRDLHSFPTRRSSDLRLPLEGAEFTENIINGVERPVKAAELFAFTLRVRAGNTDRSEERFSRNAETDLVCRLLLEKKKEEVRKSQKRSQ